MLRYTIRALQDAAKDHVQSVVDISPTDLHQIEPIILTDADMIPDISELFPDDISAV